MMLKPNRSTLDITLDSMAQPNLIVGSPPSARAINATRDHPKGADDTLMVKDFVKNFTEAADGELNIRHSKSA